MSALEIIRENIAQEGSISFARFMELALYDRESGYYEHCEIGQEGDFFTSVSVGSLFGVLLAIQFLNWATEDLANASPHRWVLLEAGAHHGRLALDILWHLNRLKGLDDNRIEYWILEPSTRQKGFQQKTLASFAKHVRWFDRWDALPPQGVTGVIFSNELLDAFPVHRLGWDAAAHRWFEWGVGMDGDECRWLRRPHSEQLSFDLVRDYFRFSGLIEGDAADLEATSSLDEFFSMLPDGYILEVCPPAWQWWQKAAESLASGRLMTFDYGLQVGELLSPLRTQGTLRAYHKHHLSQNLLERPGEQDLTASVNFSMLQVIAERAGLKEVQCSSQSLFLSQIVAQTLKNGTAQTAWDEKRLRQFQTLSHPDHLGEVFKVALFAKQPSAPSGHSTKV
jgi:SAM-dependent MidA family methyltransferase